MRSRIARASRSISSVSASTTREPATGSTVLTTPVSAAMTCCVRSAMRADSRVGRARASSRPLQCSDWVPPSTAASACSATRTMLLSGCCAVSVLPAVWVWKRICCARGSAAPKRLRMMRAHSRRAALNLATSSRKSLWAAKKNDSRRPNESTSRPAARAAST